MWEEITNKQTRTSKNCGIISNCLYALLECQKEKREKCTEEIFEEIIVDNFSKLMTDTKPQIQEVQRKSNKINTSQTNRAHT